MSRQRETSSRRRHATAGASKGPPSRTVWIAPSSSNAVGPHLYICMPIRSSFSPLLSTVSLFCDASAPRAAISPLTQSKRPYIVCYHNCSTGAQALTVVTMPAVTMVYDGHAPRNFTHISKRNTNPTINQVSIRYQSATSIFRSEYTVIAHTRRTHPESRSPVCV